MEGGPPFDVYSRTAEEEQAFFGFPGATREAHSQLLVVVIASPRLLRPYLPVACFATLQSFEATQLLLHPTPH